MLEVLLYDTQHGGVLAAPPPAMSWQFFFYYFQRITAKTDCNRLHFEGHSTAPVCL